MNCKALPENRLTLQHLLGIEEEKAEKILGSPILITGREIMPTLALNLRTILEKTFDVIAYLPEHQIPYACEVILGNSTPVTTFPCVYVYAVKDRVFISSTPHQDALTTDPHPFLCFLIACYASAYIFKTVCKSHLPFVTSSEISFSLIQILRNDQMLTTPVHFNEAYLVGAGAIGNAFLYALRTFNVFGDIHVIDPDHVSDGNLNRCLYFKEEHIGANKAEMLCLMAQADFSQCLLQPHDKAFNKFSENKTGGWLKKMIVAVDSRRMRRSLQSEIPREVFDASTTDIAEVVVHYNKQPLAGLACLSCIYQKNKQEDVHERHVAEMLGVTVGKVKQQFIDKESAIAIAEKYHLNSDDLVGLAYDTLFKQLCGQSKLAMAETKQVLAPLAFVSALAGAYLALMFIQRHLNIATYNYWKASPWTSPNMRLFQTRMADHSCECCSDANFGEVARKLWE